MIDRSRLKRGAIELIRTSEPKVMYASGLYILLMVVIGILSAKIMGNNFTLTDLEQYSQYIADGNADYALAYLADMMPPASAYAIDLALQIVLMVVSSGFLIFLLNTVRKIPACLGNLLDGFGIFGRLLLLYILEWLFILLWSLLLVVPGIIAAYRYRMAIYLLIDHPELSPMDCIRESKRMMQGHKSELFMLDLSFFGWYVLEMIPYASYLVELWVSPYLGLTRVLYYEELCGRRAGQCPPSSGAVAGGSPDDDQGFMGE